MIKDPVQGELISVLHKRFQANQERHGPVLWDQVLIRLQAKPELLSALAWMEESGGEPDVITTPRDGDGLVFCDCSPESPVGRRSLCYDQEALDGRKENKPKGSALGTARAWGLELLDEQWYRHLQTLGEFDRKTSSWIASPGPIRRLGGALFGDRRYDTVFVYHNGAESYYAARGFRALLRL